jgi:hypothetical protein
MRQVSKVNKGKRYRNQDTNLRGRACRRLPTIHYKDEFSADDLALLRRAMSDRWEINTDIKRKLMTSLHNMLDHGSTKEQIAAGKVLAQLDGLNLREQALNTPKMNMHFHVDMTEQQIKDKLRQLQMEFERDSILMGKQQVQIQAPEEIRVNANLVDPDRQIQHIEIEQLGPGGL